MPIKDLLFSFKGRIRRRDWWLCGIASSVAYMALLGAVGMIAFSGNWSAAEAYMAGTGETNWWLTAFDFFAYLPFLWVQAALAAKRSHDRNADATLAVGLTLAAGLLTFGPNLINQIMGASISDPDFETLSMTFTFLTGFANLYLVVVLGFLDGTRGPNRFGRSPKGIGGEPADKAADVFT